MGGVLLIIITRRLHRLSLNGSCLLDSRRSLQDGLHSFKTTLEADVTQLMLHLRSSTPHNHWFHLSYSADVVYYR